MYNIIIQNKKILVVVEGITGVSGVITHNDILNYTEQYLDVLYYKLD